MRIPTQRLTLWLAACVLFASQFDERGAAAADVKNGKRIAQMSFK